MMPWVGKLRLMSWRMVDFAGPVGLGDRIEVAAARLVLRGDGGAEERAGSPVRRGRELVDELREVDEPHSASILWNR